MRAAPIDNTDAATISDAELVAACRADRAAFAELYRRHVGSVHAFAYRRARSRDVADDVTATTFERALARLDTFDAGRGTFAAWILRIAANELVDHFRREARPQNARGQRTLRAHAGGHHTDNTDAIDDAEDLRVVLDAMSTLRPRHQEVLALRYLAGLDAGEAAAALGCTKGTLAVQLHRATGALRRAVERLTEEVRP